MSEERFAYLQRGHVVPLAAVEAALAIEHAGHRLRLDGDDLLIEPHGPIDQHDLDELRYWKPHVRILLAYTASDDHLRCPSVPVPRLGPIVIKRSVR